MTQLNIQNPTLKNMQGLHRGCFQHRNTNFEQLIWAYPNLIFSKTLKHNSSFFYQSSNVI